MAELQQNRYDQLIRRVGGIIGVGSMVSEAIGELFPMIDVERVPGELLALMGTGIAWGRVIAAADVGENTRVQLFNPEGSGKIIAVSSLYVQAAAADAIEMGILGVALTSLSAVPRFRDSRFGTTLLPVGELRQDTNVGATPATFRVHALDTVFTKIEDTNGVAVLTPGFGLVLSTVSVNRSLRASFVWRERAAEPSELNL